MQSMMPLLGYLNEKYPQTDHPYAQEIKREIIWIILNFSSED